MLKGVIFDLDNTLTDFMRMKQSAIDAGIEAMQDAGLDLSTEDIHTRIFAIYDREGIEYQQVFDILLHEIHGSVDPKILAAGIIGYRRARDSQLVLYPHVKRTLLDVMRRGLKLAVLSDAPGLQAWQRLCQLELHHVFDPVVTFDDTGARKPDPKPFEVALERMDLTAAEVIMVGDWPDRDVVGASKVGIRTVHARYGDTFGTEESGADFTINRIDELLPILDGLVKEPTG
jgi:putative hydrolase of the HAD superfamily